MNADERLNQIKIVFFHLLSFGDHHYETIKAKCSKCASYLTPEYFAQGLESEVKHCLEKTVYEKC